MTEYRIRHRSSVSYVIDHYLDEHTIEPEIIRFIGYGLEILPLVNNVAEFLNLGWKAKNVAALIAAAKEVDDSNNMATRDDLRRALQELRAVIAKAEGRE